MFRRCVFAMLFACMNDFDAFEAKSDAAGDASVDALADGGGGIDTGKESSGPVACGDPGAVVYGDHCYFLITAAQDYSNAKATCDVKLSHLVTITSGGEQAAVDTLGPGSDRWCGLVRTSSLVQDSSYGWVTKESRAGYAHWAPKEPDGTGDCVRLQGDGFWNDHPCNLPMFVVCERE